MWEIQLIQRDFPLTLGHWYRLSFAVKADAGRWFGLFLGEEGNGGTNLVGYESYYQNATIEWQIKSVDFQADSIFDSHKLSFEVGGSAVGMYFDHIFLEDLGLYPSIGIIGTAVSPFFDWNTDVDMNTTDGVTYSLSNQLFFHGSAKFRQDDSWNVNWGNYTFPSGYGYQGGPISRFLPVIIR